MPLVNYGAALATYSNWTEQNTRDAIRAGYIGFDTACNDPTSYNDTAVGIALQGLDRDSFFVTTKIDPIDDSGTERNVTELLEMSVSNLGLDYADLVLIHRPTPLHGMTSEESLQRQWAEMEAFQRAGKTKAIGISNYCIPAVQAILETATIKPAVNQILYHAGMGMDPESIVSFSQLHGITLSAFRATDVASARIVHGEPYHSIGAGYNKTGVQVALRWLVQRGIPVVAGAHEWKYQVEDKDILDFELDEVEMLNISAQIHCSSKTEGMHPPLCLISYPDRRNCCNLDARGGQCPWGEAPIPAPTPAPAGKRHYEASDFLGDEVELPLTTRFGARSRRVCAATCEQPSDCPLDANSPHAKPLCARFDDYSYCLLSCGLHGGRCQKGARCTGVGVVAPLTGVCAFSNSSSEEAVV